MRNIIFIVVMAVGLCFYHVIYAQGWGKVSSEELEMSSFPEAPNADVIILFDKAETKVTIGLKRIFERHVRIKVLTERGKKHADVSISTWQENRISNIEAQSFLPNGKKIKLKRKQIYDAGDDFINKKVFAIPGVEIGSVFEYRYLITSSSILFIEPWNFQNREFTKLSEFSVILPDGFKYNISFSNLPGEAPKTIKKKLWSYDNPKYIFFKYTWKLENVDPVQPEPLMANQDDYLASLYFRILSFEDKRKVFYFTTDWYYYGKFITKFFYRFIGTERGMKKTLTNILPDTSMGIERAKRVYKYVRNEIETAQNIKLFSNSLKKPYQIVKQEAGSAVEKNLLLIALLRTAKVNANPVMICTRDHGTFNEEWAQITQFNHVLVHVQIDDETFFLDTANKCCPFGILPSNCYVQKGLLFDNRNIEVIQIPHPREENIFSISTKARLDEEGNADCHTKIEFCGCYGMMEREKLHSIKHENYIRDILTNHFIHFSIDSFSVNQVNEIDEPLSIEINYQLPEYCQFSSDFIYFSPNLYHSIESNPFKSETRKFPVEFDHTLMMDEAVELNIPENIQILELPKPVNYIQRSFSYQTNCRVDSNCITCKRNFNLRKALFKPREYRVLQNLYERIVVADRRQIVLKK